MTEKRIALKQTQWEAGKSLEDRAVVMDNIYAQYSKIQAMTKGVGWQEMLTKSIGGLGD